MSVFDVICKTVKINDIEKVKINDIEKVKKDNGKEMMKEEVIIGDETESYRLVLWEEDGQCLGERKSYRVSKTEVKKAVDELKNTRRREVRQSAINALGSNDMSIPLMSH